MLAGPRRAYILGVRPCGRIMDRARHCPMRDGAGGETRRAGQTARNDRRTRARSSTLTFRNERKAWITLWLSSCDRIRAHCEGRCGVQECVLAPGSNLGKGSAGAVQRTQPRPGRRWRIQNVQSATRHINCSIRPGRWKSLCNFFANGDQTETAGEP